MAQKNEQLDRVLDVVMSYLLPLTGVALVIPVLLKSLPPWAAWVVGLPTGVAAGWAASVVACSLLTVVTRRF